VANPRENHNANDRITNNIFGQVVRIHSLAPITALQLFVSLNSHFDMNRLFASFLNRGNSSFGDHITWSFSIKYYYLDTQRFEVYPAQEIAAFHEKAESTFICRGSSSVAVQFDVGDNDEVEPSSRTPWTLLSLTCGEEPVGMMGNLKDGVEAYFWAINEELHVARRSLRHLAQEIRSIAAPSV
jgi:hypothetical protein